MVGATQIFAGSYPQPCDIVDLIEAEQVTVVGGVPTIWLGVKEICEREGRNISSIRCIPIGDLPPPKASSRLMTSSSARVYCTPGA